MSYEGFESLVVICYNTQYETNTSTTCKSYHHMVRPYYNFSHHCDALGAF